MKVKVILTATFILLLLFSQQIIASTKVLLLISEQFPQIPVKPLEFLTNKPKHEFVKFGDGIVADLYLPKYIGKSPALIIAMGVKANEQDKPILLDFAENLSRLGYVVIWPRLEALDNQLIKFDTPDTFINSFRYLEERSEVDKDRISFVGFSVGSSIAMVAAEDPRINEKTRSIVFFGGYFNIIDYLSSLGTTLYVLDGQKISWQPHESGLNHAKGILESEGIDPNIFRSDVLNYQTKPDVFEKLLPFSPDQNLESLKASIFILHEKADNFVPFVESVKLNEALVSLGQNPKAFHIANLFEHVQPKKGISADLIKEFAGLFVFLHKVFMFL